jgi:phenylalanyl-tRNA synthetase beta chain
MKVSLNWLSRYVDLKDIKAQDLANTLTLAGLEVESVDAIAQGTNLVIGEVLECDKHPESDHLSKTLVNVGDEVVSIVCGAPNVRKGQKVIVAKVGAVLPQITIKKANIKGVESNGMICSLLEIGVDVKNLTDDQKSGIEVLDDSVVVGSEALSALGLDDVIIDIKQTPNRNDCNALWSVAYEVSALLNREINLPWKKDAHLIGTTSNLIIGSETSMCPLFLGKHIGSVKVGPSIDWMKRDLEAVGMKSINNVVDISNYVMIETGQPLHFYDSSKLPKFEIIVKDHQVGTLKTLDDSDLIIDENDIVITSNGLPIGLAGIMGGDDSKIDESTRSIIIEAAQFNPTRIRHTSRRVNLLTEASLRFQKGIDPHAAYKAMDRAVQLLVEYADAKLVEETKVHGSINSDLKVVKVSHTHIEELLGTKVSLDKCIELFKRLSLSPTVEGEWISCTIPSYRLDIEVAEDLIEEVGRIIGYADLKGSLPIMPSTQGGYNPRQLTRQKIRQLATGFGMNEVITYTLVHEDKCTDGVYPLANPARLMSPLSEERRYVRNNLLTSLLDTVSYNQAHKMKDFQLFEISNLNTMKENQERLAFVLSGNHEVSIWQKQSTAYDFYSAKGIVERILFELGFASSRIKFESNEGSEFFHPLRSSIITIDKKIVGVIGEIHPKTAKKYDVSTVIMGEVILETLFELKTSKIKYTSINKLPAVIRDIALVCDDSVLASDIEKVIKAVSKDIIQSVTIFDVYQGDKVEKGKKSIALKVVYQANDHTLSEEEITGLYQKTIEACKKGLNADLRIA